MLTGKVIYNDLIVRYLPLWRLIQHRQRIDRAKADTIVREFDQFMV